MSKSDSRSRLSGDSTSNEIPSSGGDVLGNGGNGRGGKNGRGHGSRGRGSGGRRNGSDARNKKKFLGESKDGYEWACVSDIREVK